MHFFTRHTTLYVVIVSALLFGFFGFIKSTWWFVLTVPLALLFVVALRDMKQTRHAIRRNYPILGNMRFFFEFIRPEIRQYFIESDMEQVPFSRAQRSLVYQRAKNEDDKVAFGSKSDVYGNGYEWINHSLKPSQIIDHNFFITVGGPDCRQPYSLSVFNISAMSFGALSANAILALNKGAALGGFAHDTGEGGISQYHLQHGGDLIWNIGSGYFGCRDENGNFSAERFAEKARQNNVKMIELKLSQGAKPGQGGILPAAKVTPEIAAAREVPVWRDCLSPAKHNTFDTPIELLHFIRQLRELSGGKPVGFKLTVGHAWEWFAIVKAMLETKIMPDFIVVDGAEGGTGAAPLEFIEHVGTPLRDALRLVHNSLLSVGLREHIKIGVSGKIISAFDMARVMALGADWCNSARGFMFAVGCIQAQTCNTGQCPVGVATQDERRQKGLVVTDKSVRVANYHANTLKALRDILKAAGLQYPSDLRPYHIVQRMTNNEVRLWSDVYEELAYGELPYDTIYRKAWHLAQSASFEPLDSLINRELNIKHDPEINIENTNDNTVTRVA